MIPTFSQKGRIKMPFIIRPKGTIADIWFRSGMIKANRKKGMTLIIKKWKKV